MESLKSLSSLSRPGRCGSSRCPAQASQLRLTAISIDLCDPPVARTARSSESLDGCPVFTWSCATADRSVRSSAAVSAGTCA
eukprot:5849267-Pyramimonas_sp.AAC.1